MARETGETVISGKRNLGYGHAIRKLLEHSIANKADIVIALDSDGQHDPDQIPTLLEPIIQDRSDIVISLRFLNTEDSARIPRYRSFGIRTITKLTQQMLATWNLQMPRAVQSLYKEGSFREFRARYGGLNRNTNEGKRT